MKKPNYKKNQIRFGLFALALLGLSSCSSDSDHNVVETKQAIVFRTDIAQLSRAGSIESQLPAGQKIGLFIEATSTSYEKNIEFSADGNGGLSGDKKLYFPDGGNEIKISAYHPYNADVADEYTFSVETDQKMDENIYKSDLLYNPQFSTKENPVHIKFTHRLSQISYNLISGKGGLDVSNAEVSVLNVNTAIGFNRTNGVLGAVSSPKEVSLGKDGGIIVPQTISAGHSLFKIKLTSGLVFYYISANELKLESNKKYIFNITLNKDMSIETSTEVEDWLGGAVIDGDANYQSNILDYIPDPVFKKYCIEKLFGGKLFVSREDAQKITRINVGSPEDQQRSPLASLEGIQFFTNLDYLACYGTMLTTLDISKNTKLKEFICSNNLLTSIDVSKNTNLEDFVCYNNQIKSIDVSKNAKLIGFACEYNQLTSLDVSKNVKLKIFGFSNNQLSSVNLSKNTELTTFNCIGNQLTSLDVSKNTELVLLFCEENQLTSLDVSKNTKLVSFQCNNNPLDLIVKSVKVSSSTYNSQFIVPDKTSTIYDVVD